MIGLVYICRVQHRHVMNLGLRFHLFPYSIGIELRSGRPLRHMLIENCGHIRFCDFGVPGVVRVHDNRRTLFAWTEATGCTYQDLSGRNRTLHQAHIEGHEQL